MKPKIKAKIKSWLKRRISFRLHMSFILLSTVFFGIVSNYILLNTLGMDHPAKRYPLTVLLSYGWFLAFIRIYIRNILIAPVNSSFLDIVDVSFQGDSGTTSTTSVWKGEGGKFSGGGSSGSWGTGETSAAKSIDIGVDGLIEDEGAILVIVVGGLLAAVVFGSGAYFIWHSPEILSECLLQVIMVSGMGKGLRRFSEAEWFKHIFKSTVWAFGIALITSIAFGMTLRSTCPEVKNLSEYRLRCYR